jgi:hypothetical protein
MKAIKKIGTAKAKAKVKEVDQLDVSYNDVVDFLSGFDNILPMHKNQKSYNALMYTLFTERLKPASFIKRMLHYGRLRCGEAGVRFNNQNFSVYSMNRDFAIFMAIYLFDDFFVDHMTYGTLEFFLRYMSGSLVFVGYDDKEKAMLNYWSDTCVDFHLNNNVSLLFSYEISKYSRFKIFKANGFEMLYLGYLERCLVFGPVEGWEKHYNGAAAVFKELDQGLKNLSIINEEDLVKI